MALLLIFVESRRNTLLVTDGLVQVADGLISLVQSTLNHTVTVRGRAAGGGSNTCKLAGMRCLELLEVFGVELPFTLEFGLRISHAHPRLGL